MIKYWVIGVFFITSLMATNKEQFNQQQVNDILFGAPEPEKKPEIIAEEKKITAVEKKKLLEKKNQQETMAVNFLINKIKKWIKDKIRKLFINNIKIIILIGTIWIITFASCLIYNTNKLNDSKIFMV
jgi:hypothetical protein